MQWRPIETAPRDDRETYDSPTQTNYYVLLTFSPDDIGPHGVGMCVGYWDAYYAVGGRGYYEGCSPWVIADCSETTNLHYGFPTHWMPLPTPPEPKS